MAEKKLCIGETLAEVSRNHFENGGTQVDLGKKIEEAKAAFNEITNVIRGSAFDVLPKTKKDEESHEGDCSRI